MLEEEEMLKGFCGAQRYMKEVDHFAKELPGVVLDEGEENTEML